MKKASAQICCLPHNYIISSFHKFMAKKNKRLKSLKNAKKTKTEKTKQSKEKKKKEKKKTRRIVYGRKYQKDAG